MINVTEADFFKAVGGPENIHPRSERECSTWEIVGTRQVIGKSEPGYASVNGTPHRYWLEEPFLKHKRIKERRS